MSKISPKTPKIIALALALAVNFAFFAPALAQEPMVGEIRLWAGSTAPAGWAICDGTIIYTSLDYDPLLSVIGYNYGGAFELGYFQLPDLRGRVPVGRSDIDSAEFGSLGDTGGEKTHTLTTNEMPSHNHQYIDRSNSLRTDIDFHTTAGAGNGIAAGSGGTIVNRSPFIRNTGGGQPHNNLQPYQVVNFIIYTGVGLPTPTPTMTPTPTITPTLGPTATFTPMTVTPNPTVIFPTETPTGTMYLPSVLSQTLSSGNTLTVPLEVSAGEAIISMVMLSVVGLVSLTVVYRVVKP